MIGGNPFTIADTKIVVEMWQAGSSAVAIAAKLGNGRTRNSILGCLLYTSDAADE